MPTYEYTCDACGGEFELEQRISEPPIKKCPKCRKAKVRRLVSQGNFFLKGSGWGKDLYSGPSNTRSSPPSSGSTSKSTSDSAKSDKTASGSSTSTGSSSSSSGASTDSGKGKTSSGAKD